MPISPQQREAVEKSLCVPYLSGLTVPIIYKTYAAREKFDASGSAVALVGNLPEASYVQSPAQLKARLTDGLSSDDLILVLGAGDIYSIIKTVLDE